jgi:hypothetical protein
MTLTPSIEMAGRGLKKGPRRPARRRAAAKPAAPAPATATPVPRSSRDAGGGGGASKRQHDADPVRANSRFAYTKLISWLDLY